MKEIRLGDGILGDLDINDPTLAPFFDFLRKSVPWLIFFKYLLGLAPAGIDLGVRILLNY